MRDSGRQILDHPRRVTLLGSTGFIGRSALQVISALPERLEVFALSAGSNAALLAEQILLHRPKVAALADASGEAELRQRLDGRWKGTLFMGPQAMETLAGLSEPDVVLNGMVGAAGLRPTWSALRAGRTVALANKESLVIAGSRLMSEAGQWGGRILPVDSEHSGIFQCLDGHEPEEIRRIVLTASGGPFRTRPLDGFASITAREALRHPVWEMGARITIDSATLLNKGFEILEARWLFQVEPARIEVWIHPQSIVHGLVEWRDGSTTAQLSLPDMRLPIQYALCHPERAPGLLGAIDLTSHGPLEFGLPEPARYPCLGLARRVLDEGGTAPAVLNAADEIVVEAFLHGRIRFTEIHECLARVLDRRPQEPADQLEVLLEADHWARGEASRVVDSLP
jgi:1-deoxy-D-xylulose-5-phosphate reductoisomerase